MLCAHRLDHLATALLQLLLVSFSIAGLGLYKPALMDVAAGNAQGQLAALPNHSAFNIANAFCAFLVAAG